MRKAEILLLNGLRKVATVGWARDPATRLTNLFQHIERAERRPAFEGLHIPQAPASLAQELRETGLSKGIYLSTCALQDIVSACHNARFKEDGTQQLYTYEELLAHSTSKALRWLNPHLDNETVQKLVTDERIVETARQYLNTDPILHSSQIWLLQPPAPEHAQGHEYGWHYDIDDFRFLKLFIYLTDTEETGGEHMLVRGSHRDKRTHRMTQRRIADADIKRLYPSSDIMKMQGRAGEGFFEDTWLYHRATPPHKNRLMLQIEFCATGVMKKLERRIYS